MIHKSTLEKLSSTCKLLNTITKRAKSTVIKLRVTFKMTKWTRKKPNLTFYTSQSVSCQGVQVNRQEPQLKPQKGKSMFRKPKSLLTMLRSTVKVLMAMFKMRKSTLTKPRSGLKNRCPSQPSNCRSQPQTAPINLQEVQDNFHSAQVNAHEAQASFQTAQIIFKSSSQPSSGPSNTQNIEVSPQVKGPGQFGKCPNQCSKGIGQPLWGVSQSSKY